MKVLHLISGGDTGGAKTHVFALMNALANKIDVKIVCFMKGVFYDELQSIPVESELIEQKSRMDMSVCDRLIEIISEGYQVIHCHGARANFIAGALRKRGVKLPFVTTIHSDYLLDFDGFYKKLVYTTLNVNALKKFDYYIAVSSNFKDMLISRGFRPNSVYTVYNGMDYSKPMEYCADKKEFAKRVGIEYDPECVYIGLIGRHDYVKGHDVFINAAKLVSDKCPNARFVIAGDGDGRAELVKQCEALGISDKVTFCGFIKDIYSFINFIDINTLTSRCESFPYVLMEGARLKKATVSSRVGGIPDLILDGECGLLFEKENFADLSEKLISLVSDKELAQKYGENLYTRATTNFSNEKLACDHVDIYNSIISDHADSKKYDVSLSGYYGFNNCGDDALLHAIINDLREQKPDIRINVFSASPKKTMREYAVDSSFRFDFCGLSKALKNTKMLVNGGGSLIQDATSSRSLRYYTHVIKKAKKLGCKVFVYANGIGPVSDKNVKLAGEALSLCDGITLRESSSVSELSRLGISPDAATVTADPAITLRGCSSKRAKELLQNIGIVDGRKIVAVSVRDWPKNDPSLFASLAAVLDETCEKYDVDILFVPMKMPDDLKTTRKVASLMKRTAFICEKDLPYDELIGIISQSYLMIGMRLHTLIFSVGAAIPTVGIIYDPKIDGFLDYVDVKYRLYAEKFEAEKLSSYISEIMENYDGIKQDISQNLENITIKAKESAAIAVNLLSAE